MDKITSPLLERLKTKEGQATLRRVVAETLAAKTPEYKMGKKAAKKALLDEAIEWIAMNDDVGDKAPDACGALTVALVADVFGKSRLEVARAVVKIKKAERK